MQRAAAAVRTAARVALVVLVCAGVTHATIARAEEKMVGVVTKIDMPGGKEAKTATATLKDTKTEKETDISVTDDLTLDKFKDHRIQEGDEIRCKYDAKDGKNVSTYFRKTAGC